MKGNKINQLRVFAVQTCSQSLSIFFSLAKGQRIWRMQWQPTPVLLPGKSQGRRSLVGCSPWGLEESDTTEHFHFSLFTFMHWSGLPFPSPMHESEKWKWSCSVVSDSATPWTAAYQAPPSMGFSRQEYWSGVPLRSLDLPIVLFSSISLHWSLKKAFLSFLAIL